MTLLTSLALVIGSASPVLASAVGCQNGGYYIIFARGMTAHLESQDQKEFVKHLAQLLPNTQWAELGNLDWSVTNSRDDKYPDDLTHEYPASWINNYSGSVTIGRDELVNHLNRRYDTANAYGNMHCDKETAIIGGYSEGADVVGWALNSADLSQAAKDHIGYAALYGDPRFDVACWQNRWWVQANARCDSQPRFERRSPYIGEEYHGRFGSWCDDGDGFCAVNFWTLGWGNHVTVYRDYWYQQSAHILAAAAITKRNQLNPALQPQVLGAYDENELGPPPPPPPPPPVIKSLKRTLNPDGTRHEVYAATKDAVTEAWWQPGGDGVHTDEIISIPQGNIVGFDKVNMPDGATQTVYTAVPDGVWESWWRPGTGVSSTKIVTGLPGVRQVIADNHYEGGQYVHRLYILTQEGPWEVYWKDGGDGIHANLLNNINGPVAMAKSTDTDDTDQLYVATPTWVYELWWRPGQAVGHAPLVNIPQGDIRSLAKQVNANGTQQLFTQTSTTVWRTSWGGGSSLTTDALVPGQSDARATRKTVTNGTDQLYLATADHVQEYYWNVPGTGGSGGTELFRTPWNNITAIDKSTDGAAQQLYTAAGDYVWETWWGNGAGPTTNVLFRVTR